MICDCCNREIASDSLFVLSTTQVTGSIDYWKHYYNTLEAISAIKEHPEIIFPERIAKLANDPSAWAICSQCIGLFSVDRKKAREWGALVSRGLGSSGLLPEGYVVGWDCGTTMGAADLNDAMKCAEEAWRQRYGAAPQYTKRDVSVQFIEISTPAGTVVSRLPLALPKKKWWRFWK